MTKYKYPKLLLFICIHIVNNHSSSYLILRFEKKAICESILQIKNNESNFACCLCEPVARKVFWRNVVELVGVEPVILLCRLGNAAGSRLGRQEHVGVVGATERKPVIDYPTNKCNN